LSKRPLQIDEVFISLCLLYRFIKLICKFALEMLAEVQQKTLGTVCTIPLCALMQCMAGGEGLAIWGLMGNLRMYIAQQYAKDIMEQWMSGRCQQMARFAKRSHDAVTRLILMATKKVS